MTILLLAARTIAAPAGEFASVLISDVPGKWPGGQFTWYYNPADRPANISDAEVIAAAKTAFSAWQSVCQLNAVYGGITAARVDPPPITTYVVGWANFGDSYFKSRSITVGVGSTTVYAPPTGAAIQINTSNTDIRSLLDNGSMAGAIQHEIGHTLGLAHSDDPTSIMFANPYNTATYAQTLQGDDIAACADLYGGKGISTKEDLRNTPIEAVLAVKASVLAVTPSSTIPASSLVQIDPIAGGPLYFDFHWQQLAVGANIEVRWVTPDGSVYDRRAYVTATSDGYRFTTFPDDAIRLPYAGRWAFQVLVDGRLGAIVPFEVMRGTVSPVLPFEAAMIGEGDGAGNLKWRTVTYGNGKVTKIGIVNNGRGIGQTVFRAQPGDNVTEVWAETDRTRYKLDLTDGQPSSSFDAIRQAQFVAGADGLPVSSRLLVSETGTRDAYSAIATITATGTDQQGVYVAATLGGTIYFRQSGGWSERVGPLVTIQAPAVTSVDLIRNLDTRELPVGTALYVGYGRSLDEMLVLGQYTKVHAF